MILLLAVLVEHRLVTDTDTDTGPWLVPRMHSIACKNVNTSKLSNQSTPGGAAAESDGILHVPR